MNEYVLRDEMANVVTVAPLRLLMRFLRDACPRGEYSVEGPDADCTVYQADGVLYPSSGTIRGVPISPRSLEECRAFFEGR